MILGTLWALIRHCGLQDEYSRKIQNDIQVKSTGNSIEQLENILIGCSFSKWAPSIGTSWTSWISSTSRTQYPSLNVHTHIQPSFRPSQTTPQFRTGYGHVQRTTS